MPEAPMVPIISLWLPILLSSVFRFTGVTAFACYTVALWQDYIWLRRSMRRTVTGFVDGLLYALVTAGTFGWLWPE
jgi:hypothetical protein